MRAKTFTKISHIVLSTTFFLSLLLVGCKTEISGGKVPLVIAMRFSGGQGPVFLNNFAAPALADLNAFIISPTVQKGLDWSEKNSTDMLKALIDSAIQYWPVDPEKIVITGYSLGGYGAWSMASSYPQLISAVIPMASSPGSWMSTLTTEVPVYVIHGELDQGILLSNLEGNVQALEDKGLDIQLIVATDLYHGDVDHFVSYLYEAIDWLQYTVWLDQ